MKKVLKDLMLVMVMTVLCLAVAVTADAATSGGFIYEVVDGEATITGYTGNGGSVVVPAELGGFPVTAIGDWAFSSIDENETTQLPAHKITSITLPDTVKTIGDGAFMRVNLSYYLRTLINVQNYTFNEVKDLSVFIPDNVETIDNMAFVCMEMKGSKEKYTNIKINVFYGGTEAQWKAVYSDDNITREETFVDIEDEIGNAINTVIGDRIDTAVYTDKNTVEYNCTCVGHIWKETDRTYNECQEGNTIEYRCTLCGETKTETVAPKDHNLWNYPTDEELSAFCGEREFWVGCSDCDYTDDLYVSGTGDHSWQASSNTDCTYGSQDYYCYLCSSTKTETYEPKDHEWENYPDASTFCGERYFFLSCKNCDVSDIEVYITGTAKHDWERDYEDYFDCEEGGMVDFWCYSCDSSKEEYIAPDSHIVEWHSNDDATCTEDGTKYSYCSRRGCDADYIETVTDVGSALGHDYNEKWTVLTTATCTYPGISIRACKRCADIESSTEAPYGHYDNDEDGKCDECKVIIEIYAPNDPSIPADPPVYPGEPDDTHIEHTYGNWTEKDGIMYRVCTGCGNVETKDIDEVTPDIPEDPSKDCSCYCHKSGFVGIIWKILKFFYKLFRINPVCACGIAHY